MKYLKIFEDLNKPIIEDLLVDLSDIVDIDISIGCGPNKIPSLFIDQKHFEAEINYFGYIASIKDDSILSERLLNKSQLSEMISLMKVILNIIHRSERFGFLCFFEIDKPEIKFIKLDPTLDDYYEIFKHQIFLSKPDVFLQQCEINKVGEDWILKIESHESCEEVVDELSQVLGGIIDYSSVEKKDNIIYIKNPKIDYIKILK